MSLSLHLISNYSGSRVSWTIFNGVSKWGEKSPKDYAGVYIHFIINVNFPSFCEPYSRGGQLLARIQPCIFISGPQKYTKREFSQPAAGYSTPMNSFLAIIKKLVYSINFQTAYCVDVMKSLTPKHNHFIIGHRHYIIIINSMTWIGDVLYLYCLYEVPCYKISCSDVYMLK